MVRWNDKYSVKVSKIDNDHKRFIDTIDKAIVARKDNGDPLEIAEVLSDVLHNVSRHFMLEEIYMIKFEYPDYRQHKEEHLKFTTKAAAYLDRVTNGDYKAVNETLKYVKQWLVKHIYGTDRKYIECFSRNGLK